MDRKNFPFFLAGMNRNEEIVEIPMNEIFTPHYIKSTQPKWAEVFQKEIAKASKKGLINSPSKFTSFCLRFAKSYVYKGNSKAIKLIKELEKEFKKKNNESFEHRLGKAKAVFWLLDSGFNPEWIKIEKEIMQGHRPDVSASISLKGLFFSDYYTSNVNLLNLAIEIGDWHRFPSYLEIGIPFAWSPFRNSPMENVDKFIKEQREKYNFKIYPIQHYIHILDSTFTALLFIPIGGRE